MTGEDWALLVGAVLTVIVIIAQAMFDEQERRDRVRRG